MRKLRERRKNHAPMGGVLFVIACSARETSPAPLSPLRAGVSRCRLSALLSFSFRTPTGRGAVEDRNIGAGPTDRGAFARIREMRRGSRKMAMLSGPRAFDGALDFEFFHPFPQSELLSNPMRRSTATGPCVSRVIWIAELR
jgi:hypothetical protein